MSQQGYETPNSTWLEELAKWIEEKQSGRWPEKDILYKWTPIRLREIAKILKEKIECDIIPEDNGEWFCRTHQKRIAMIIPKDCNVQAVMYQDTSKIYMPYSHYSVITGIQEKERREPTTRDFKDPRFDILWSLLKGIDVQFENGMRSGVTGNDIAAILDRLDRITPKKVDCELGDSQLKIGEWHMNVSNQDNILESLIWAEKQLHSLVTEDEGSGSFIRGTGTELAGFHLGMDKLRKAIRECKGL